MTNKTRGQEDDRDGKTRREDKTRAMTNKTRGQEEDDRDRKTRREDKTRRDETRDKTRQDKTREMRSGDHMQTSMSWKELDIMAMSMLSSSMMAMPW